MVAPVEFVDYIFNRYAYLGVSVDADENTIRGAIRRMRAQNHPDKLERLSEAIARLASRANDLLSECERVLLNVELRPAFNARLSEFQEKHPNLVSVTGDPIVDVTRFRIDAHGLLLGTTEDLGDIFEHAARLAGFHEQRLARARTRYAKVQGTNDEDMWVYREDLRRELTAKLVYLTAVEDFHWQTAGVHGMAAPSDVHLLAMRPDHFEGQLQVQLDLVKGKARELVQAHDLLLESGLGRQLLLPYSPAQDSAGSPAPRDVEALLLAAFESRTAGLKAAIAEKQSVVAELLTVSRSAQIRPDSDAGLLDIVFIRTDEGQDITHWPPASYTLIGKGFRIRADTAGMTLLQGPISQEALDSWPNALILLELNRELPGPMLEAVALAEAWLDKQPRD